MKIRHHIKALTIRFPFMRFFTIRGLQVTGIQQWSKVSCASLRPKQRIIRSVRTHFSYNCENRIIKYKWNKQIYYSTHKQETKNNQTPHSQLPSSTLTKWRQSLPHRLLPQLHGFTVNVNSITDGTTDYLVTPLCCFEGYMSRVAARLLHCQLS